MQRIKILKKVVNSSSMTIGSSIMSSETELANSDIETASIGDLVERLNVLETKAEAIIDDDDDRPLFFKKKKDTGTQTPGDSPGPTSHSQLVDHTHNKAMENYQSHSSSGLGVGVTGLGHQGRKSIMIPQGNEKAPYESKTQGDQDHRGEEWSMMKRETRYGIPGVENSGPGAILKKHRMSILKMGKQKSGEDSSENDQSPPKEASRKPRISLKGFLQKFGKGESTTPAKVALFGNMNAATVADIEDQLSRAREIQRKGIELELRCETLEKQEANMAKRLHEAEEEMERMRQKYANMDEIIEEKYRQYVLQQQMLMQMRKKRAGGSQWLENLSENDRKAEEKRMIMRMRAASHAKKRADARAAEEAAAEEKRRKIAKEKEDALNYDSDEDDKKRKKNFKPKLNKLHAKGEHQKTKGEMQPTNKKREIKQPGNLPETAVISITRLNELITTAKSRLKLNNLRIRAVDVADANTSTDDFELSEEGGATNIRMRSPQMCDLRSPTPMQPTPNIDKLNETSVMSIDTNSQLPLPKDNPEYRERSSSPLEDSRPTTGSTYETQKEYSSLSVALSNSENPLFELFIRYGPILANEWNAKLLRAAALEATMGSPKVVRRVFDYVSDEIRQIETNALESLHDMALCEKSVSQLAELKRTNNTKNSLFRDSLAELYKLLGTLQAKSVLIDFKLGEYRSLFESLSVIETTVDLGSCEEFTKCYGVYLVTQGKAIELSNRLISLKEAGNEYGLCENLDLHLPPLTTNPDTANCDDGINRGIMGHNLNTDINDYEVIPSKEATGDALVESNFRSKGNVNNQQLQKELEEALEEADNLRTELFAIEQQKDRTPGALLFFAGLYDPNAVHAMGSLIESMKNLQGVAMCKEHIDFQDLRKRMLTCLTNVPPIERLLLKFNKMHSKWTESRYKLFSTRNQAGGDADTFHTCPLCAQDARNVPLSPIPNSPIKNGNNIANDPDSFKESVPDFTISSKMVISPFAKRDINFQRKSSKSPIKCSNKAIVLKDGLSSPVGTLSPPHLKKNGIMPPNTPPLRLNSPGTLTQSGYQAHVMTEDLHRRAVMNTIKNKNW